MAESAYEPRMKADYRQRIRKSLKDQFGYSNEMQIPKLDKIVVNMGIGEAVADSNGRPTRVGFRMEGDKKVRFAKTTGEVING